MTQEIESIIKGILIDNKILISNKKDIEELMKRGYGFNESNNYYLYLYEALYLLYINKFEVLKDNKNITFDELVKTGLMYDDSLWTRFLIYRDLRNRGYVVREGFGFGVDFRVYERGTYNEKPAKYVVFGLEEGKKIPVSNIGEMVEDITKMGKEPVIAVIERRGEIIYYKISKVRFNEIKRTTLEL